MQIDKLLIDKIFYDKQLYLVVHNRKPRRPVVGLRRPRLRLIIGGRHV